MQSLEESHAKLRANYEAMYNEYKIIKDENA